MDKFDVNKTPVRVSPLIKAARWSFLITGIIYGSARLSTLNRRERLRKEELERTRPEREAKAKADREKKVKEELDDLYKQLGM